MNLLDRKKFSKFLKKHENRHKHNTRMIQWMVLEMRLQKNRAVDKHIKKTSTKGKKTLERCVMKDNYIGKRVFLNKIFVVVRCVDISEASPY